MKRNVWQQYVRQVLSRADTKEKAPAGLRYIPQLAGVNDMFLFAMRPNWSRNVAASINCNLQRLAVDDAVFYGHSEVNNSRMLIIIPRCPLTMDPPLVEVAHAAVKDKANP